MSANDETKATASHEPAPGSQPLLALMFSRFVMHWPLKLLMVLTIPPAFLAGYLGIQQIVTATRTFDLIFLDRWAGFDVWWVYIYVSQYLIVPLPPLLAHSRDQLRRLAVGLTVTSGLAFLIFLFYPVAAPRQPHPDISNAVFDWLMGVDSTANAFPSLHVGLSTFAALYAHRVLDEAFSKQARIGLLALIWTWTALIAWSTMATKQHYFYDVLGGFAVACAGHFIAWRGASRS